MEIFSACLRPNKAGAILVPLHINKYLFRQVATKRNSPETYYTVSLRRNVHPLDFRVKSDFSTVITPLDHA